MNKKKNNLITVQIVLIVIFSIFLVATYLNVNTLKKQILSESKEKNEYQQEYLKYKKAYNELKEKEINKIGENDKTISKKAVRIPIITFHRTVDHETKLKYFNNTEWVNDISVTEEELKYLKENGWNSIDLDEFYCWYNKECEFDEKTFVITIDDGDSEAYYILLPVLEKYGYKATLFSIGKYIPDITEPLEEPIRKKLGYDKIKELRENKSLLQVESHSYDLHSELKNGKGIASSKSKEELIQDFKNNTKYNFRYLAYPFGYYDEKLLDVVANNSDIKLAFIFKKKGYATRFNNRYEISRIKISGKTTLEEFKKWFEYKEDATNKF